MKVGDYVRTKKGIIGKIKAIDNQTELEDLYLVKRKWYYKENIIKSSPNIIDLIEVGDYVNGVKVDEIKNGHLLNYNTYDGYQVCIVSNNKEIKSILTKEMFESMKYEVK